MTNLNKELLDTILRHEKFEEIALNNSSEYVQELVRIIESDIQNSIVSRLDNIASDLVDKF